MSSEQQAQELLRRVVTEAEYTDKPHSTPDGWTDTKFGRVLAEAETFLARPVQVDRPDEGRRDRVARAICASHGVIDGYERGGLLWDLLEGERRWYYKYADAALAAARLPDRPGERCDD